MAFTRLCIFFIIFTAGFTIAESKYPPLILANKNGLSLIDLESSTTRKDLLRTEHFTPYSIDFIGRQNNIIQIFWSDLHEKIKTAILEDEELKNVTSWSVDSSSAKIENVAVDWLAGIVYWTVISNGRIDAARIDGSQKSVVVSDIAKPRALAVDPIVGYLFWSDLSNTSPCIERSSLSGGDRKVIVRVDDIGRFGWLNAIALDRQNEEMYWVDAKSHSIHVASYDGSNQRKIYSEDNFLSSPFYLTYFDETLIWSQSRNIFKAKISGLNNTSVLSNEMAPVFGVKILDYNQQLLANNLCRPRGDKGECSHLCVRDSPGVTKCLCPYGMILRDDERTCTEIRSFLVTALQTDESKTVVYLSDVQNKKKNLILSLDEESNIRSLSYDYQRDLLVWLKENSSSLFYKYENRSGSFEVPSGTRSVALAPSEMSGDVFIIAGVEESFISRCSFETHVCSPEIIDAVDKTSTDLVVSRKNLVWMNERNGTQSINSYSLVDKTQFILEIRKHLCCLNVDPFTQEIYWLHGNKIYERSHTADIKNHFVSGLSSDAKLKAVLKGVAYFKNLNERSLTAFDINLKEWISNYDIEDGLNFSFVTTAVGVAKEIGQEMKSEVTSSFEMSYDDKEVIQLDKYENEFEDHGTLDVDDKNDYDHNTLCTINTCANGGTCIVSSGQHTCACPHKFWGSTCEFGCPCVNGRCTLTDSDDVVCECYAGFKGVQCELDVCDGYCLSGNCSIVEKIPICHCTNNWRGERCEHEIRLCSGEMCNDERFHHLNSRFQALVYVSVPVIVCLSLTTIGLFVLWIRTRRLLNSATHEVEHKVPWRTISPPLLIAGGEDKKALLEEQFSLTNTHV